MPNCTPVRRFSLEQRRALEMLASAPRGISEQSLVVAHGFAAELLAEFVLAGLATERFAGIINSDCRISGYPDLATKLQIGFDQSCLLAWRINVGEPRGLK
jgi:hypothetical protein